MARSLSGGGGAVNRLRRWLPGERGQDLVEYALVTLFLSMAIVLTVAIVGLEDSFAAWAAGVGD